MRKHQYTRFVLDPVVHQFYYFGSSYRYIINAKLFFFKHIDRYFTNNMKFVNNSGDIIYLFQKKNNRARKAHR